MRGPIAKPMNGKEPIRYLTIEEYFGKRAKTHESELQAEYVSNARVLVHRVNRLLESVGWKEPIVVASGWRPESVNKKVIGAAKKSGHITGQAIDIQDLDGVLGRAILRNVELLRRWNLWMEDLKHTIGWVHLDIKRRSEFFAGTERERPHIFIP